MSGFGLGGFGTGFLQGFEAMGANFARRGLMQAEQRNQARSDRKLQLEEELDRLREERAAKEAESVIKHRDADTRITEAKEPYVGKLAGAEVEGQTLANRVTQEKLPYVAPAAEAEVKGLTLRNTGQDIENQGGQAKLPYIGQSAAETLKGQELSNQDKGLDVGDKQRQETTRVKVSESLQRIKDGNYTQKDLDAIPRLSPIINLAKNPSLRQDTGTVIGAIQQAAQNKGDVEVFNQPEIMGALNRTFGEQVNVTRGMPLTDDGRYVAQGSELVKMIRHPTENLIGFEVRVQPEPTAERKAEIAQALKTASPQQAKALQAELNPAPYQTALTDQRIPVAQGGKMRWFTPQEVQKAVVGLQGIGQLQASQPELINELIDLQGKNDRGELNAPTDGKALEQEIKVRKENRDNREEARKIEADQRSKGKDRQSARGDAFKEATAIIDKEYGSVDELGGVSFAGDRGRQASEEKLMVDKVLRRNPGMSGAAALSKARKILEKQGQGATAARSGVQSPASGKKDYSGLWQ